MSNEFWNNFYAGFAANFLSDLMVGLVGAFWIARRINAIERGQQRTDEKRAETEKAIRYLELLQKEVSDLLDKLPSWRQEFKKTGWGVEFKITTPIWDVLHQSGELPRLLGADLVSTLAKFYDHCIYVRQTKEWVMQSWLVSQPNSVPNMDDKLKAFINATLRELDSARTNGECLPGNIASKIQLLKAQLETL